jgi:Probable cobalt transporter subunit (CbtA)
MEKKLILRGIVAGAVAGVLAFVFARIFAEPLIGKAVDYESGRDAAQAALDKAAGLPTESADPDIFSRTVQANVGGGVGILLFGMAMGALFAVAYTICLGRVGQLRPRTLALLVAGGGFLGFCLVPFIKYPANPPSIGHAETIRQRSGLYLVMVFTSIAFLVLAAWLGRRLKPRFGNWTASLLAGAAFVVAIGIVMAILPAYRETPTPLTDAGGTIVYPGFPADVLFGFRFYSVAAQLLLWGTIGLVFAPLADRLLRASTGAGPPDRAAVTV